MSDAERCPEHLLHLRARRLGFEKRVLQRANLNLAHLAYETAPAAFPTMGSRDATTVMGFSPLPVKKLQLAAVDKWGRPTLQLRCRRTEDVHIQAPLAMIFDELSDWTALRHSLSILPLECVGANKLIAIAELLLQALFFQGHQKEHALLLKHKPRLPDRGFEGQPKHAGICSRVWPNLIQ